MTTTTLKTGFYGNDSDVVYVTDAGRIFLVASEDGPETVSELNEMLVGATPVGDMLTPEEAVDHLRRIEAEFGLVLIERPATTILTNNFHNTEYRTTKTRDELDRIEMVEPWNQTEAEKAFVRKVRRALCGCQDCKCAQNSFGERS